MNFDEKRKMKSKGERNASVTVLSYSLLFPSIANSKRTIVNYTHLSRFSEATLYIKPSLVDLEKTRLRNEPLPPVLLSLLLLFLFDGSLFYYYY